jgi:hypothetical protein
MSQTLTLARHSLHRSRALLLVMTAVLVGFEVLLVFAADTLQESGTFSSFAAILPPFVRQVFGDSVLVFMSYTGLVAFGYFHPMIVAALVALVIGLATEPVADVETRFLDVVLARPVRRSAVVTRSVLLIVLGSAAVIAAWAAATLAAMRWMAPPRGGVPSSALVGALAVNLWAVLLCVGGVALAVAAAARRRSAAAAAVGLVMLALFLIDYLARIWKPATLVARVSPFHYYDAMAMVMGRPLPIGHLAVLGAAATGAVFVAYVLFSRRDL